MNQCLYYHGRGDVSIDSDPPEATVYTDGYALQDNASNVLITPVTAVGLMIDIHEIQISTDRYYSKKIFIDVVHGKLTKSLPN